VQGINGRAAYPTVVTMAGNLCRGSIQSQWHLLINR